MNKIILIGNVGHTPEIKTVGDAKVASFSLGETERGYTRKDGTKVEDKTNWFNCQVWRNQADVVEKFVKKGDKLYVEGRMTSRKYTGNDGTEKTAWDVNVAVIELLTPKGSSQGASSPDSPVPNSPVSSQTTQQSAPVQDNDSDLPF